MRLTGTDPDIQTLVSRIKSGIINLQPDFQRGEVWSVQKKRRLLDTVLRDWHIPPIHLIIVEETQDQEVLDGQQRLVAIRDFVQGLITVDGFIEPYDAELASIDNCTYENLPDKFRRRFDGFTIRVFRITDYEPEEPGELFYRLNQPTNLTAAEQRNAYFGPARQQVKMLVKQLQNRGIDREILGFSNSRMAYDDVIARLCYSLEKRTLWEKVTSNDITAKFRSSIPFDNQAIIRAEDALRFFGELEHRPIPNIRFNKATFYSWLCFLAVLNDVPDLKDVNMVCRFIYGFELLRYDVKANRGIIDIDWLTKCNPDMIFGLIGVYNDRASARVADVSSVQIRDLIIWLFFYIYHEYTFPLNDDHPALSKLPVLVWRA
jgi:hypothetical protein